MLSNREQLTGLEKAAIILLSLADKAPNLLKLMHEEEIREIAYTMSKLGTVSSGLVTQVLAEFQQEFTEAAAVSGDIQTTKALLEKVLTKEHLENLVNELHGPQGRNTWDKLGNVNEEILASYLKNEHPQVIAVILSKIAAEQAAKVLRFFTDEMAHEIIHRMLNLGGIKKEILDEIENNLRSEFIGIATRSFKQDSYSMLAAIFNHLESTDTRYIKMIEQEDPEVASKIKNLMFTFEDLVKVAPQGIQALLRSVERDKLILALKAASDELKELLFANMSKRQAQLIQEELQMLGRVRIKEVHEAQVQVINHVKELIAKGEADIYTSNNEEYIS